MKIHPKIHYFIIYLLITLITITSCTNPQALSPTSESTVPTAMLESKPTLMPISSQTPTLRTSSLLQVGSSGQYQDIQEAIDSAQFGDTIQVAQGIYQENITISSSKKY